LFEVSGFMFATFDQFFEGFSALKRYFHALLHNHFRAATRGSVG
jgi:hypothetical protein